jgi:ABC-type branched-subunit amino acid transport system substrate-binding protein
MVLHQPVRRNVFNVRATYQREAEKAITHLASMGITRIAVVLADDSFGADGLAGAQKGLAAAKLTALVEKFDRSKPDFSAIAPKITEGNIQAVMMIASGAAVVEGVKAFRTAGSKAQIVTLSNNASGGFIKSLGDEGRGMIVTQVFPHERSMAFPMVKEALDLAKARGVNLDLSPAMLEGFAAAKVLVEGLKRAGPNPSREKIQAALESIRKYDLGGLEVSYSPDDHTGLNFADLSIIGTDGRFRR